MIHTKNYSVGLLATVAALGFLTRAPVVEAKEAFPGEIARHLSAPHDPPCGLCHEYGKTGSSTLVTPFAWAMRARGMAGGDSLLVALDRVAADDVDSDGDASPDIDEIVAGSDPNTAASTPAHPGTAEDPQLGCAVAGGGPAPSFASTLAVALLMFGVGVRRRSARPAGAGLVDNAA